MLSDRITPIAGLSEESPKPKNVMLASSFLSGETADDWDFAALRRHYLNWLS